LFFGFWFLINLMYLHVQVCYSTRIARLL
jgi:hypothetical protein